MRQRRKCLYRDCGHNQGNNVLNCKFHSFPKDSVAARRWLTRSGIFNVTPHKIISSWTICSCHFLGERRGNAEPVEYLEPYDDNDCGDGDEGDEISDDTGTAVPSSEMKRSRAVTPNKTVSFSLSPVTQSPAAKVRRADDLTPGSKLVVEALMSLPQTFPPDNLQLAQHHPKVIKSTPSYSPRRRLWAVRASVQKKEAKKSARKELTRMLDFSDFSDLGVSPINYTDRNNNSLNNSFEIADSAPDHSGIFPLNSGGNEFDVSIVADNSSVAAPENSKSSPNNRFVNESVEMHTDICDACGSSLKKKTVRSMQIQCNLSFLCYEKCKLLPENDFQFYTGLTQEMFELLYKYLGGDRICCKLKYEYNVKTPKREQFVGDLSPKDKLFMTSLRLRRGIPLRDLGVLFKISEGHASKCVYTWIRFMSLEFKKLEKIMFTSTAAQHGRRPKCFEKFENLRVIIDAFEIRTERPKNLQQQSDSFSDYKGGPTLKFLIGISCFGGLSFLSEAYHGSITDRKLVDQSGFMDHLLPGDGVMADRGFDMEDRCDERNVDLFIPAFLRGRDAFTARELILSRAIAVSRVFVECFIGKIKEFRLVRYMIPNTMLPIASDLVRVCAFLVNFQFPFIQDKDSED